MTFFCRLFRKNHEFGDLHVYFDFFCSFCIVYRKSMDHTLLWDEADKMIEYSFKPINRYIIIMLLKKLICFAIQRDQSEVRSIDCEIQPEKGMHFFCFLLFWESFNCNKLWNHWSYSGGAFSKMYLSYWGLQN